ncbi:hypothetical protein E2C01_038178 [Portunus trituberculatus]|uniref:Uncharacterized protein n=1 Tax=Portunus trituberculatus TaxID=210409 RepID=A0A5B7FG49_PORTR|nr:hypothetical protein [Portunus trituberculatus]
MSWSVCSEDVSLYHCPTILSRGQGISMIMNGAVRTSAGVLFALSFTFKYSAMNSGTSRFYTLPRQCHTTCQGDQSHVPALAEVSSIKARLSRGNVFSSSLLLSVKASLKPRVKSTGMAMCGHGSGKDEGLSRPHVYAVTACHLSVSSSSILDGSTQACGAFRSGTS